MKRVLTTMFLLTILAATAALADVSPRLERALADPDGQLRKSDGTHAVWVRFHDRLEGHMETIRTIQRGRYDPGPATAVAQVPSGQRTYLLCSR